MAKVTVSFADYQEGRLPPVCVVSGRPTGDRVRFRTVIRAPREGRVDGGGLARRLDDFVRAIDPRAPRDMLLGLIPLDAQVRRRLEFRHRVWTALLVASTLSLLTAAGAGAAWSPVLAVVSTVGIFVSIDRRKERDRALPVPQPTHGGAWVVLDNVHDRFASAASDP